jgi:ribosomal protein S24E
VSFLNVEIKSKKENLLLSRIEVGALINFEKATPSAEETRQGLAKALEVEKDLIAVKKISTAFGHKNAKVLAYQYFSKEDLKNIEPKVKAKKEKKEGEAAPAAKK